MSASSDGSRAVSERTDRDNHALRRIAHLRPAGGVREAEQLSENVTAQATDLAAAHQADMLVPLLTRLIRDQRISLTLPAQSQQFSAGRVIGS
jgi:hypothetical protein